MFRHHQSRYIASLTITILNGSHQFCTQLKNCHFHTFIVDDIKSLHKVNNKKTKFLGVKDSIIVVSILFITGYSTVSVSNGTLINVHLLSSINKMLQNISDELWAI